MSTASSVANDPSGVADERHILAPDDPLIDALAWLWTRDPELARHVEKAVDHVERIEPERAKDGSTTLSTVGEDGKIVQLHSRYRPIEEAHKLVDNFNLEGITSIFVYGLGLGYHVERLFERTSEGVNVWVFEPRAETIVAALREGRITQAYEKNRLKIIHKLDRSALTKHFQSMSAQLAGGLLEVDHAATKRAWPTWFSTCKEIIDDIKSTAKTAMNTIVINGRQTAQNVARNLPWYVSTPSGSRLCNACKNEPAIIVSAGPSLRKNKHLLKDAKGRAVIIAVQTTLQPLLDMGIEPDFVTSLDYSDVSRRFYEKLPRDCKTELVVDAKANDVIPKVFPGPVTMLGYPLAENLLREMSVNRPALKAGATVAHLAFYLAQYLGCDPIILVGQDLGFSDGLAYLPGTSYDDVWAPELGQFVSIEQKQWEQIVRDRAILKRIPDWQGKPMYTEQRLLTYLRQFEKDFSESRARVIDATEGGAQKAHTQPMTLAESLAQFCKSPMKRTIPAHPGLNTARLPEATNLLTERRCEALRIEQIANETLPLLEEIRDFQADQRRVNRAIAQIDSLRKAMNGLGKTYDLVMSMTMKSEFERFKADTAIGAAHLTELEKQKRQTARDIDNVRAIQLASTQFIELVDEAIDRLTTFTRSEP